MLAFVNGTRIKIEKKDPIEGKSMKCRNVMNEASRFG
jgi:hypothetical protein